MPINVLYKQHYLVFVVVFFSVFVVSFCNKYVQGFICNIVHFYANLHWPWLYSYTVTCPQFPSKQNITSSLLVLSSILQA